MAPDYDRYLKILELQPGATPDEIKTAYRDMSKVWHPYAAARIMAYVTIEATNE